MRRLRWDGVEFWCLGFGGSGRRERATRVKRGLVTGGLSGGDIRPRLSPIGWYVCKKNLGILRRGGAFFLESYVHSYKPIYYGLKLLSRPDVTS